MKYPIFQLCLSYSAKDQTLGLVFPQESDDMLSMTFALPVAQSDIHHQIIRSQFYFPATTQNEEFELDLNFERFTLYGNFMSQQLNFSLLPGNKLNNTASEIVIGEEPFYYVLAYVGQFKQFAKPFAGFLLLNITQTYLLSELYRNYDFALIGFTPKFGSRNWIENE